MKILVCIKQVPDLESRFKINAQGTWFEETDLAWRMNEYDEYAVEQAVLLKEQVGEADITILSVGADRVVETIKKALAMGGDRGVHVRDAHSYEKDPFEIASIIAEYARDKGYDLIFMGMQSQDRGSAQVGVLVGEMLGVSVLTTLVRFECDGQRVRAERELEGGLRAKVSAPIPALVTCQLGLNKPRYPTLPNIMKAKKKEIQTVEVGDLLKANARIETIGMYPPVRKGGGLILEGDVSDLAERLLGILKEKTTVIR